MFFGIAELQRKLKNIVRITSIVTPNETKALATVKVGDDESIEFPVVSFANSFKRHWIPIRKNEQVLAIFPFGNANKGFIFRGIFWKNLKEPLDADKDTEVIEYEDGTKLSYSTKESVLAVQGNCKIIIEVKNVTVKAEKVIVESGSIELGGIGGLGVITEKSICPFTKAPHTMGSTVTKSL